MSLLDDMLKNGALEEIKDSKGKVIGYKPKELNFSGCPPVKNTEELEAKIKELESLTQSLETTIKELEQTNQIQDTRIKELEAQLKECQEQTATTNKTDGVK